MVGLFMDEGRRALCAVAYSCFPRCRVAENDAYVVGCFVAKNASNKEREVEVEAARVSYGGQCNVFGQNRIGSLAGTDL